jgi:MFS family permease
MTGSLEQQALDGRDVATGATDIKASRRAGRRRSTRQPHLSRTFEGFGFPPFRWYMGAMIWWNAAMSMQMLVSGYLAYHLTDSFVSLGVVSLGSAGPMLLLSPLGGVIADRSSRRAVLQFGQMASLAIALGVAALVFSDTLVFGHLVVASVAQGTMSALVLPSRQSLLPEVVGMGRLMNAIPLQTAGMNLMQILAPALGGFMIDWIGPGWVYVGMATMYAMSVGMLFFVQSLSPEELERSRVHAPANSFVADEEAAHESAGAVGSLREISSGFVYLTRDRVTLTILAFSFVASILGMPIRMLMPGYVGAVFGDEGSTLGLLQMGMGIGALFGALVLAAIRLDRNRGLLLAGSAILVGISLIAFSLTGTYWLAWIAIVMVGIGSAGRMALGQILVQEYVQNDYRGRVMAIYMMQFSLMSVGTFAVSLYMESVGAETAIFTLGAGLILATVAFLVFVPRFRSVD